MLDKWINSFQLSDTVFRSDYTLFDDYDDVSWKETNGMLLFQCSEHPKLIWRFPADQMLEIRGGEAGVFVAKDIDGQEHLIHFYQVLSPVELQRITPGEMAADMEAGEFEEAQDREEEARQAAMTEEERAAEWRARMEAADARSTPPIDNEDEEVDPQQFAASVVRIKAENTALMEAFGIKRALPQRKAAMVMNRAARRLAAKART